MSCSQRIPPQPIRDAPVARQHSEKSSSSDDAHGLVRRIRCECANWQIEIVVSQFDDESRLKNKGDTVAIAGQVIGRFGRFLSESETGRFTGCSWQTTCAEDRRDSVDRVEVSRAGEVREQGFPEVDLEHGERRPVAVEAEQEEEEPAQYVRQLSRFAVRTELRTA